MSKLNGVPCLRRPGWSICWLLLMLFVSSTMIVFAQSTTAWPLLDLQVNEPEQAVKQLWERAKLAITNKQWDEALDLLQQTSSQAGNSLMRVDGSRFLPLQVLCQQQLAQLPPQALQLYRQRVDGRAAQLYQSSLQQNRTQNLLQLVEELFASSSGDQALLALGEDYLQRGIPDLARYYWQQLHPQAAWTATPVAIDFYFPDTKLELADIQARLILCSIAEQAWPRAKSELEVFQKRHPTALGQLAGRRGKWYELLSQHLEQEQSLPSDSTNPIANQTFAQQLTRHAQGNSEPRLQGLLWEKPWSLGGPWQRDLPTGTALGYINKRHTEDPQALLSIVPLLTEKYVLWCDEFRIYAIDRVTGQAVWPSTNRAPGEIYRSDATPAINSGASSAPRLYRAWGGPRFTVTVAGDLLLARIGSPMTRGEEIHPAGEVVCLDLSKQGLPVWILKAPSERWILEGTPLVQDERVYQLWQYQDARTQWYVSCHELSTGQQLWRTKVCAGESLTRGQAAEVSHQLLAADHSQLYLNPGSGFVACLNLDSGAIRWLNTYTRPSDYWQYAILRELCPPLVLANQVLIAPRDSRAVFSYDRFTGQRLWTNDQLDDVEHLLGQRGNFIIVTGRQVHWLNAQTGQQQYVFPDQADKNLGAAAPFGRGLIAGNTIYWPQRGQLARLLAEPQNAQQIVAEPPLPFAAIATSLTGGHLQLDQQQLLISTPQKLWLLGPASDLPRTKQPP
jgi:outer membrane protein assembly factor BamB